jgi:hypothetical protein
VLLRPNTMPNYMPMHTVKPYGSSQRNGALFVVPRFTPDV